MLSPVGMAYLRLAVKGRGCGERCVSFAQRTFENRRPTRRSGLDRPVARWKRTQGKNPKKKKKNSPPVSCVFILPDRRLLARTLRYRATIHLCRGAQGSLAGYKRGATAIILKRTRARSPSVLSQAPPAAIPCLTSFHEEIRAQRRYRSTV